MTFRFSVPRPPVKEHPRDLPAAVRRPHVVTATAWWSWLGERWPRWGELVSAKYRPRALRPGDAVEIYGTGEVLVDGWHGSASLDRGRTAYDPSLPPGRIILARVEAIIDLDDERSPGIS